MLDCPTGGPGCVPDTASHQRWHGPGQAGLGYIQKFIMHYEVLLLTAALPSLAPTTTGWAGGWRVRVGEGGSGREEQGGSKEGSLDDRKYMEMLKQIGGIC